MIGLVVGAVLTAALLAASLPAIGDARADRTAAQADASVNRIWDAAGSLLATDDPVAGRGARRVVTVWLPARTLTSAAIERFVLGCRPTCAVDVRFGGGRDRTYSLGDLPLRTPTGPVLFGGRGRHRLVLGLRPGPAGPIVTARAG